MGRILLVEDDRVLSETVRKYLEHNQHIVERAFEGPEGLEKMQYGTYDLIILDWQLPGMTGIDICTTYRGAGGKAPVIMLTGNRGADDVEAGKRAGADEYLPKPFKLNELKDLLERVLSARTAAD